MFARTVEGPARYETVTGRLVAGRVNLNTVQELMRDKAIAMTARNTQFATPDVVGVGALVSTGSVSVQSGCKLAIHAKEPRTAKKVNNLHLIEFN